MKSSHHNNLENKNIFRVKKIISNVTKFGKFVVFCALCLKFFITAFLPEVLVSSSNILKTFIHPSMHRRFLESTPFLTFCGGIISGLRIICGLIWGSYASSD